MKPLPAQHSTNVQVPELEAPPAPPVLTTPSVSYSKANRRASPACGSKTYPLLLAASTALAGVFCILYITKPVIVPPQAGGQSEVIVGSSGNPPKTAVIQHGLMPDKNRLPGEKPSATATQGSAISGSSSVAPTADYEQTNLRVQHILSAEGPGGQIAKIDLDVPVLYQSRNLRWTSAEVAEARALLTRLSDYREKSRAMRVEGADLLESWNRLIAQSIPSEDLRADSPTLPANQQDAAEHPRPVGLDTAESIKIQPVGK